MTNRRKQLAWLLGVMVFVVCLDQTAKALIRANLPHHDRALYKGEKQFFYITHEQNTGLVGGAFRDSRIVAKLAPLLASAVLIYLFWHLDPASICQNVAYGMVAGGAIGNLIDRFRLGHVTDFLQFHFYFIPINFPWKHYPAFNFADSAICIGVFLLVIGWRKLDRSHVPQPS
ncbi:MAG: signal peptidase II [Candidatus Hydrogenedentes bacterium]|nr:signal peptidase II [Candidatus Hydrogenedentota bacterium]